VSTASEVLNAAMSMNLQDRCDVVHQILLSLEPNEVDTDVDQAWAEEIRRRQQAIRDGRSKLRDWDEALSAIRQAILISV
jgi:putative addiction module component (TIGR02574 family)